MSADTIEATAPVGRARGVLGAVDERFLVPVFASPRGELWSWAHAALELPFLLWGRERSWIAKTGGRTLEVVTVGRASRPRALLERWFDGLTFAAERGLRRAWSPDQLARLPGDLIVVSVHRWLAPRFRAAGWMIVPEVVRWEGALRWVPPAVPNNSLGNDLRKLRRNGFTSETASAPADWREFETRMVVPMARARYGSRALLPSSRLLRELAARGTLVFVRLAGERVAGLAAVPRGRTLWIPLAGIRDGDPDLLHRGASAALYALSFEWARERGFERVDWGRSTSFANDGLHRYRRNWGLHPVPDPLAPLLALRLDAASPVQPSAVFREPVLIETDEGLRTLGPVGSRAGSPLGEAPSAEAP
ncbi:MAG TPA: GNAT family N-acetyltransferase [Gemmatimonadota bacterium]|jgi:hypothetical protein